MADVTEAEERENESRPVIVGCVIISPLPAIHDVILIQGSC